MQLKNTTCCGLKEAYGLYDDPVDNLVDIGNAKDEENDDYFDDWGNGSFCFILFTDTVHRGWGRKLANYIKKHKFGSVVKTPIANNPNSGNNIEAWIWRYNEKFSEWLVKQRE